MVKNNVMFHRWRSNSTTNVKLCLLLLGALRYLGRCWCFDDLEEATCISQEVHRVFFHKFVSFGKDDLYPVYVKFPTDAQEMSSHTKEYKIAGFHGAVGSMDVCHVLMEKCSH